MTSEIAINSVLCVTIMTVIKLFSLLIINATSISLFKSRAAVTSSSSRIFGFFIMALARAIFICCPPERDFPFSPITVSYPSGNSLMKLCEHANSEASIISSFTAFSIP
mmetsp:Transcript_3533/g.3135  ORF Transcript_3533/g.3135 Transcript_3533/m.3135 type:complete len:109 (-) Transcript_3533:279-605(-)